MIMLPGMPKPSVYEGRCELEAKSFAYFALCPLSRLLQVQEQIKALVLSILMGIPTLGIGQLICKIICEISNQKTIDALKKLNKISQKLFGIDYKKVLETYPTKLEQCAAIVVRIPPFDRKFSEMMDAFPTEKEMLEEFGVKVRSLPPKERARIRSAAQSLQPAVNQIFKHALAILEMYDREISKI